MSHEFNSSGVRSNRAGNSRRRSILSFLILLMLIDGLFLALISTATGLMAVEIGDHVTLGLVSGVAAIILGLLLSWIYVRGADSSTLAAGE
ncbi:DUF485 domain-containing protein [Roseiarcaceae bacterium H3SJ34-1]|uniref:DUF485 domain-containing protein n=1 Tax=Terripilifer ovatus TaxID=3032367 RepID=UPI003AB97DFE|nr:DUF485 domain-containing protein [Roseiarcaceae bacterium H3SJ34-1]